MVWDPPQQLEAQKLIHDTDISQQLTFGLVFQGANIEYP